MSSIFIVTIFLLLLVLQNCRGFLDDQPKFLTEDGNFIIESATDRNITFRLLGRSCVRINDINVMNLSRLTGDASFPPDIERRLSQLELQISSINVGRPNQGVLNRLQGLENRVRNGTTDTRLTGISRRLRVLENRLNTLMNSLNSYNCTSNPCKNGATCLNSANNGYLCRCLEAWTGDDCENDVNECAIFAGTDLGCQNGATCTNTFGSYACTCMPGWVGLHCIQRTVDCLASSSTELCGKGACVHTNDAVGYRCICDQGWTTDNVTPACTVDVDECSSPQPHCSMDPQVICINLPGSFMCGHCPPGFTGNGHYCRDINECEVNNGGCSVAPMVSCINSQGSSHCDDCPVGYAGDGRLCVRNDHAACANCHPLAHCSIALFGAICLCPNLYTGSGYGPGGCILRNDTIDICAQNPCQNGGNCTIIGISSFVCQCPPNTLPPLCAISNVNPCANNPCQNGGNCVISTVNRSRFQCMCPPSHSGTYCQNAARQCGGVLNAELGVLKYPQSDNYPHNSHCAWLIRTNASLVLNVTFTKFNLEHSHECRFDWLQIHDGRSSAAYVIGRFCGTDFPKGGNIVSTQNMLYLWFRSDNSTSNVGFELNWNSIPPVCGGDIEASFYGTISSPGSPGNYPPNRDCIWHVYAPYGKRIQMQFYTMRLEAHATCQYDYLAIYNGLSTDDDLLEKFCNTSHPAPLTTPSNEVTLHFHSDADLNDAGFQIHYTVIEGVHDCGGIYTRETGQFGSPMRNGIYLPNLVCHYLIRLPKNSRIKIQFQKFVLEASSTCVFDSVEIYEGSTQTAPQVGRWCGTDMPPAYESLGNVLLLVFKSDMSSSYEGFTVQYDAVCGGKFEVDHGTIMSPLYPNIYQENRRCDYHIEAPMGKAIKLDFSDFDMEGGTCDQDYLEIFDGSVSNATKMGRYCGQSNPGSVMSTMNYMHLVFQTDGSIGGRGFKGNYTFEDIGCGGIIKQPGLTITPPTESEGGQNYKENSQCSWVIIAPTHHVVQLTFEAFYLEAAPDCQFDSLTVYDGYATATTEAESPTPIGTYCGTHLPPVQQSGGNILSLVFRSDEGPTSGLGFTAVYNFIEASSMCGGKIYTRTGTITSPGFPKSYQPSQECIWIITAPAGKQIELVVESFELEQHSPCESDFLEIRNGANEKSPLFGTFCGTDILPYIKSFGNHIYLRFKTNSYGEYQGFQINFDTSSNGCGGVFSNTHGGSITSPNYPEPYAANMQCDWRVSVNAGSTVLIFISDMAMEDQGACIHDYLEIYDGTDGSARSFGRFCNSNYPIKIESTTNNVFMRMRSDFSHQGRGFDLKFITHCRREIHDIRGVIESPNYPSFYPHNTGCEWKIVPLAGNKLYIEFSSFDIESSDASNLCQYDHLTIEERNPNDVVLRSNKYCDKMPSAFTTPNTVVLKFETDASNADRGFHLEFESIGCGGILLKPEGVFSTPNYPKPYPLNTKCLWTIQVDYGHLIEITFHDFDFEAMTGCLDGLIIENEVNDTKPIAHFCGSMHKTPGVVTTYRNKVFVNFYSDVSYSGRGFTATYRQIPLKCGGLFTLNKGQIVSPNYPKNYVPDSYCEYLIRTEPSHTLNLKFTDFDLESTTSCNDDFVQVYDGHEKRADRLLSDRTCGTDMPNNTLRSDSNELLVIFKSDSHVEAKGFAAEFETACGAKINTSGSGILEIGHNLRWSVVDCRWTIRANNPNQHVSLSVLHIENDQNFRNYVPSKDVVSDCLRNIYIHEGTSTDGPLLLEICSSKHPPTIVSAGNALTIAFSNIPTYEFSFEFEFKAYYTVIENECGGNFTSLSGQLASPGFPRSYPNNIECEWTIEASPGNLMDITIEMLDIDQSENCNDDYLEIRERSSTGKLLGVFCGNRPPSSLPSANLFWLKFRSNNDGVGLGFKLEYNYAKHVEQTGESGVITSPLYPSLIYFTPEPYTYGITVAGDHVVTLEFGSDWILNHESSLIIKDGPDIESPNLIEFNFAKKHQPDSDASIQSTTNTVFIRFETVVMSETKFKINWQISAVALEENSTDSLNCSKNSLIEVGSKDVLQLRSPGYPNGYDTNLICKWTFYSALQTHHVAMSFITVDLESTPDCLADYVHVDSANDLEHFSNVTRACSPNALPNGYNRMHGTPNLRVIFQSNSQKNGTGFDSIVYLVCGGRLTTSDGELTQKLTKREDKIGGDRTCDWIVEVRRGRTIQFNFTKLHLRTRPDGSCLSHVIIRNGPDEDSPFLGAGKFCGTDENVVIERTSSNKAHVQYVMDYGYLDNDFTLQYQQVEHDCGGFITLTPQMNSTIIATPHYPNIPDAHIECIWRIIALNGNLMQIDVVDLFDLTESANCETEYLELREGNTAVAPLIGRYCKSIDQKIFTTSNSLRLHYFTDIAVPRNGFKLKVSLAKCGRSIRASSGSITSPGYSSIGSYPLNAACDYYITGKEASSLNISFVDLHLPYAKNCHETDHIVISAYIRDAYGNVTLNELNYVCGTFAPPPILTGSSRALIKFVTKDKHNERRGFHIFFKSSNEVCGQEITASSGTIESPGYPMVTSLPLECEWYLTVPKGRRITIEILDFDMVAESIPRHFVNLSTDSVISRRLNETYSMSVSQGLTFYNDFDYWSRIRHIGSSIETTQPIKSTDNKMLINADHSESGRRRGFRLRFSSDEPSICDGNFDQNEGSFETPSSNNGSFYCEYYRQTSMPFSENGVATLAIKISVGPTGFGTFDCNTNIPTGLVFAYAGMNRQTLPSRCPPKFKNIATPYDGSRLIARNTHMKNNFRISYKIHKCGALLLNTTANITLPTLPPNYGELDCAWVYESSTNQRIQLSIMSARFDCEHEYLNIYNGGSPMSPRSAVVCGEASNDEIISISASQIFIEYHTDNYNATSRFQMLITSSDGICGGTIEEPNFAFSSPKNGTKYPSDSHCEWIIRSLTGFHIGLTFVNRFMIETSNNCTKDYVEVYDRIDEKWIPTGRFCGRDSPPMRNSTGTEMKVVFHSDNAVDGDGFSIEWTQICGGIFYATKDIKFITSPRYPQNYLPNMFCNYSIIANKYQRLTVKFLDFDLEDSSRSCPYDNITIYREDIFSYPLGMELVGTYCWPDSLKTAMRNPSRMHIVFRTDKWNEKRGFKFQYHTDLCGGSVTQSGFIESPTDEETNEYLNAMICTWNITAPVDKRIVIRFEQFDLDRDNFWCEFQHLEVYEGTVMTQIARKARLCGNLTHIAPAVNIQTNNAIVHLVTGTTHGIGRTGFKALVLFMKNCDHVIHLTIANPTYTLNELHSQYEPFLDCHYVFNAPAGYVLRVKFNQFHLAPCLLSNISCKCDYVTILDGAGPFSEPIGTYCGNTNPSDAISSGTALWMRFSTDGVGESTGFSATVQMVSSICGEMKGNITDSNLIFVIESPSDGGLYLPNLNCLWELYAPNQHIIDIKFERFDLQGANDDNQCTADYLEIRDAADEEFVSEGLGKKTVFAGPNRDDFRINGYRYSMPTHTYCGNSTPIDYLSNRKVLVRFKTDESVQKTGFTLTAKLIRDCERNYTSVQGRLRSGQTSACEMFISVPENYTISLYFAIFDYHSELCTADDAPIIAYDGKTGQQIERICGEGLPNPLFTSTNVLKLKFNAGELNVYSKTYLYDITYMATDKGRGCGGEVFNYAGVFTSPGYPNTDRNDSDCRWTINVPQNLKAAISFSVFDMGSKRLCDNNFIEVIEPNSEQPAQRFCGTDKIAPIKGKTNTLHIRSKSGRDFAGTGWVLYFAAVHGDSKVVS